MIAVLISLLITSSTAPEKWSCVQNDYEGRPVTNTYVVDGAILKEGRYEWPYQIVTNTPTELIATYPSVGTVSGKRVVNARTVVIDKVSGDLIANNIDLWASADENRPVTGRCARETDS